MHKIQIIKLILVLIFCIIIFIFSNTNSNESNKQSKGIIKEIVVKIYEIKQEEINEKEINKIVNKLNKPIRKIAHFTLYFILEFLILYLLLDSGITKKELIISIIFCFIYSLSDEFHQIFVNGRTGQFIDCIIDLFGASTAAIIFYIIKKRRLHE